MAGYESHPLLDSATFVEDFHELGFDRTFGSRVFNRLVSHSITDDTERTATALAYRETNRAGEEEAVVSLPNLAAINDDMDAMSVHGVGVLGREAIQGLLDKYGVVQHPEAPMSFVFWYGSPVDDPIERAKASTHRFFLDAIRSIPAVEERPTATVLATMRRICASGLKREDDYVAVHPNGVSFNVPIETKQPTVISGLSNMSHKSTLRLQHLAYHIQQMNGAEQYP